MKRAPKPIKREKDAPPSAVILPFRLRASREEQNLGVAPEIVLEPKPKKPGAKSKRTVVVANSERLTISWPRYRDWLKQAAIAALLLHVIVFSLMYMRFNEDLERAANAGGAASSADGTILDVVIVTETKLPPAKTQTNAAPDAKAKKSQQEEPTPAEQKKAQVAPTPTSTENQAPPPPVAVEAPNFALPQAPSAQPQEAETAPAAQSPNPQLTQDPRKPEPPKAKEKTAEQQQKKKKEARSAPSVAAAPARAAPRNNQGPAGSQGAAQTPGRASASSYNALVSAHLQRFKTYPAEARSSGVTGTSRVRFTLVASGAVVSASLAGGSGAAVLDQAAVAIVRRASPFPPIPPSLGNSMSFTVPLNFSLR